MKNTKKLLVLFSGAAEEHSARRGLLLHVLCSCYYCFNDLWELSRYDHAQDCFLTWNLCLLTNIARQHKQGRWAFLQTILLPYSELSILIDLTKIINQYICCGKYLHIVSSRHYLVLYFIYLLDIVIYFGIFDKVRSKHFNFFFNLLSTNQIFFEKVPRHWHWLMSKA